MADGCGSALVFTFLAIEAVKTASFQPNYNIIGYKIPTFYTPIFWMVLVSFLMPGSSLLGHFCGMVIGYACMFTPFATLPQIPELTPSDACRYLRLLEPSEWILTKVEQKLGFILRRLPWYVDLEARQELNYMEMLPAVGGGPKSGNSGVDGGESSQSAFSMPGRTLSA